MNIVIFTHPSFQGSQSMPRYAQWLADGMRRRGHKVKIWSPLPLFYRISPTNSLKKWMGYIDQYIIFPLWVKISILKQPSNTLYVFSDQALGPWIPIVKNKPHVIHCHDFLAQRSAVGEIPENPTSRTGQWYQTFIRRGFKTGKNFICISKKTQEDLHRFVRNTPRLSEVVYNGLTQHFAPATELKVLREELTSNLNLPVNDGFILHVGGSQWYKNKKGIIALYNEWRKISKLCLPLILVGKMSKELEQTSINSDFNKDIYVIKDAPDDLVRKLYAGASVFLFPSLAEGFGWPIAEAMASGCPVITTNEAPMTEVGGNAAFYVRKMGLGREIEWAIESSVMIERILQMTATDRNKMIEQGLENVRRFDSNFSLSKIESIYNRII